MKGFPQTCSSFYKKFTLRPQKQYCTQEGVNQGADGTHGFKEELWQLVFISMSVFCLAAHLHRVSFGGGISAVRHFPSSPSDNSNPSQAPLPE